MTCESDYNVENFSDLRKFTQFCENVNQKFNLRVNVIKDFNTLPESVWAVVKTLQKRVKQSW